MIIEICPKCGHDLLDIQICVMPPISRKKCQNCGWSWESKPEQIIRIPFDEHKHTEADSSQSQEEKVQIGVNQDDQANN